MLTNHHLAVYGTIYASGNSLIATWMMDIPECDVFAKFSSDNGRNWPEADEQLSEGPGISYAPIMTSMGNTILAVWADERTGAPGLYCDTYRIPTNIAPHQNDILPQNAGIVSAYPNPFNSSVILNVKSTEAVSLGIYDIGGRRVTEFNIQPGDQRVLWDGRDRFGHSVTSGVYTARLGGDSNAPSVRMIYLK